MAIFCTRLVIHNRTLRRDFLLGKQNNFIAKRSGDLFESFLLGFSEGKQKKIVVSANTEQGLQKVGCRELI